MTDYKIVRQWFQRCRDADKAVRWQKDRIRSIREQATRATQSMSGMPSGSTVSNKTSFAEEIADEERKLQKMEDDLALLRLQATRRAYLITDSSEQAEAIYEYYVNGLTQNEIAYKQKVYDPKTVGARIKVGCQKLAQIWEQVEDSENAHFAQSGRGES